MLDSSSLADPGSGSKGSGDAEDDDEDEEELLNEDDDNIDDEESFMAAEWIDIFIF